MLQVIILVLLLGGVEVFEGLHADVDCLTGFGLQGADTGLSDGTLFLIQIVDRQGVGMAPVDELAPASKGSTPDRKVSKRAAKDIFSES